MRPFIATRNAAASFAACAGAVAFFFSAGAAAQGTVNALCSTDAGWCEAAAAAFTRETGIKVQQAHKGTGEIGAQLRAEAANPKTDIWWGGTGDPFLQAAEQGLLEPYRPAYINDLHDWAVRQYAMSQNMVGGFYTSAIGFGFNTDLLKKKKLRRAEVLGRPASSPSTGARSKSRTPPRAARPTPSSRAWCSRWARTRPSTT